MKLSKSGKQIYVSVVRQMRGNGETMTQGFVEFDKEVNAKIAEGYMPYGSLVVDHCSASSMDVIQPMMLKTEAAGDYLSEAQEGSGNDVSKTVR